MDIALPHCPVRLKFYEPGDQKAIYGRRTVLEDIFILLHIVTGDRLPWFIRPYFVYRVAENQGDRNQENIRRHISWYRCNAVGRRYKASGFRLLYCRACYMVYHE